MECSRQESWSWSPFPTAGDLPDPGIKLVSPVSPALAGRVFATMSPGNPGILCSNGPESASGSLPALLAWVWDAEVTSRVKLPQRVETPRPEGPLRVHTQPHLSTVFPLPLHPHLQPMLTGWLCVDQFGEFLGGAGEPEPLARSPLAGSSANSIVFQMGPANRKDERSVTLLRAESHPVSVD